MLSHRLFRFSAGLIATLLLGWLPAISQTSTAPAAKPGTISGRVVNESGRPLPNARIVVRSLSLMGPQGTDATSDREGKFELNGLQPLNYQISAYLQGYAPLLRDLDDTQFPVYRVGDSVTLMLTKGGVITGTVTTQAGEPVVGVNVRAQMVNPAYGLPLTYIQLASDLTDDRGVYRIYGLMEGTYVVWAGGGSAGFTTEVDPFDSDVPTYAPASTRDTAQEIVVRAGAESNGIDIQYRGGSGRAVSGTARGPEGNQPLPFAIFMVSTSGPPWQTRSSQGPNERGFIFNGVDDGDYSLTAISQLPGGELMFSAAKQLKVRGADVSGIELLVQPLSSVAGRVVLEDTKIVECNDKQRPVFSETLVSAHNREMNAALHARWLFASIVNADERGNVSLKNLPAGRYYFTTQHFAKDWYLKSLLLTATGKPLDAARTWTTLKPGDRLNGLTITLAQGAASLRAQIVLSEGETLAEKLYVYLVPAEKGAAEDPLRFYSATVTADGKVALDNLAPGRYLVLAATDESASPLAKLRSPDETTYRAKLRRQAEAAKTELELKPCQKMADFKVRFKTE